jgi:putative transposase
MARQHRNAPGGVVYHVMNRGSRKGVLFETDDDYIAFERLVSEALEVRPMRIIAYCLMWNHVHFLLWPEQDGELSRFMHWLTGTHASAWRHKTGTRGEGAVYQSRFTAKPMTDFWHLLTVWRYIERNPLDAQLVARAEEWPWSSACQTDRYPREFKLTPGPCERPSNWLALINSGPDELSLAAKPL